MTTAPSADAASDAQMPEPSIVQYTVADIALPVPLPGAFSYSIPASMRASAATGSRCVVNFRKKRTIGVIVGIREQTPSDPPLLPILRVLDPKDLPTLPITLVQFAREIAGYYFAPLGEVTRLMLPPEDAEAARETQELSLFGPKSSGISPRRAFWFRASIATTPNSPDSQPKLTPKQGLLLSQVRAAHEISLGTLTARFPSATTMMRKLVELGLVEKFEREVEASPFFQEAVTRDEKPTLTRPQSEATVAIAAALDKGVFATFLLHGVTGSGKTEVYLRAVERAKELGKASIVLVPEIALTPQLVSRFRARFGDDVAVIHSALTDKERWMMWRRLRLAEIDVVVGARSALFAPLSNIGLIVVDEEHDSSFKQEEGVRYHARDMAILRAHREGAVCILGSATPSLEALELTHGGKAKRLSLPERARAQIMPKVEIIDLRKFKAGPTGDKRLTMPLYRALQDTLARGEQSILFLNRRGFSPSALCEACGTIAQCPHCSVALTFHKRAGAILRCHYCEFETAMVSTCKTCHAPAVILDGLGTEKLEDTLSAAFPTARVARLDRDVAGGKNTERILDRVRKREVDILVGTQMVTKGHDLPHVTLVGIVNADAALSLPDFRASERAFQLFVQVAGRAGRGDTAGRVILQTYDPKHTAVLFAAKHDVDGFLKAELEERRSLGNPPFSRLALIRTDAVAEDVALAAAATLGEIARAVAAPGVEVLGPSAAPLARLRNRFRFRVLLRAKTRSALKMTLIAIARAIPSLPRDARAHIDVDPVQLL